MGKGVLVYLMGFHAESPSLKMGAPPECFSSKKRLFCYTKLTSPTALNPKPSSQAL